tara:strand:+ start:27 stop:326 length:300 start_codon:yes stop_codon:yes gene_type:complete
MGKFKLKDQLAGIAALIAAIVAIGGGFVKYGEITTKLDALSNVKQEKVNLAPLDKKITDNGQKIADNNKSSAINAKEIELLQIQLEEIKVNTSNPLSTQ